jgi:hypothetical protein
VSEPAAGSAVGLVVGPVVVGPVVVGPVVVGRVAPAGAGSALLAAAACGGMSAWVVARVRRSRAV